MRSYFCARRQQVLARVSDRDVDLGVREHVAVDRRAVPRDSQDCGFELGDVHALDRGKHAEPSGRRTGAEADDQRVAHVGMERGSHHAAHDLRGGVLARIAVDLPVDDEGRAAARLDEADAALAAVGVPQEAAPLVAFPGPDLVGSGTLEVDAAGADWAVTPGRRRPVRQDQQNARGDPAEREQFPAAPRLLTAGEPQGPGAQRRQQQNDRLPRSRREQDGQQSESAGERTADRPERVPGVGQADVLSHALAAAAEEADELGKLVPGHEGRREDDQDRDLRPGQDVAQEPGGAQRPGQGGEEGEAVSHGKRQGQAHGFECRRGGQRREGGLTDPG